MNETLTFADLQDAGNAQSQLVLYAIARSSDWETGETFANVKRMAPLAKCSEKTFRRHLDRLEEDGLIEREERKREDGGQASNLIRLAGYQKWLEINKKGGRLHKPKAVAKYETPPGQPDQPPPGQLLTSPPGQQGDQGKIITNIRRKERGISDFEKGSTREYRDTSEPFAVYAERMKAEGKWRASQ